MWTIESTSKGYQLVNKEKGLIADLYGFYSEWSPILEKLNQSETKSDEIQKYREACQEALELISIIGQFMATIKPQYLQDIRTGRTAQKLLIALGKDQDEELFRPLTEFERADSYP